MLRSLGTFHPIGTACWDLTSDSVDLHQKLRQGRRRAISIAIHQVSSPPSAKPEIRIGSSTEPLCNPCSPFISRAGARTGPVWPPDASARPAFQAVPDQTRQIEFPTSRPPPIDHRVCQNTADASFPRTPANRTLTPALSTRSAPHIADPIMICASGLVESS